MDRELIADCVHCGFCLPACPTYDLWREEMDSPRGRIHLMKTAVEADTATEPDDSVIDATWVGHIDACLGCMACVSACPSGVQYGSLIELTRTRVEQEYRRPWRDRTFRRMLFTLFPGRKRLRVAAGFAWLYQRLGIRALLHRTGALDLLPARLRSLEAVMPSVDARALVRRTPAVTPADGTRHTRVGFIAGCVQEVFFGDVNAATVRVLAAHGCEVVTPRPQGCCGALELHGGREPIALRRARKLIDTFESLEVDAIVINAAGCGSALKDYGRLLADDPVYAAKAGAFAEQVRDVTEVLAHLEPQRPYQPVQMSAVYHDACHLAHAQGIRSEPRALLGRVPGVELRPLIDDGFCCGSAGIYNLVQPEAAEELGRRKATALAETGADVIVTTNPGCALQIRRYLTESATSAESRGTSWTSGASESGGKHRPPTVLHPAQVLDAALNTRDHSRNETEN
jgi:glycolate oxidase iron-sulfur subunit